MSDVLDFQKATQKLQKQMEKGKTPTKKAALGAMMENQQLIQSLMQTINRLASSMMQLEKYIQQVDTNLRVMGKTLTDKNLVTDEDIDKTWYEMVEKPKEEALQKHIDMLKAASAEDAFFGACLERVRSFAWVDEKRGDQTIPSAQIKGFFINMLVNPATRHRVLDDLRKYITDLPEWNPKAVEAPVAPTPAGGADVTETAPESRSLPDCRYCGKPDCPFCSKLEPAVTEKPAKPECCGGTEENCCHE